MPESIQSARTFQELLDMEGHSHPYYFDKIFNKEGMRAKARAKQKFKLLKNIDPLLRKMLQPDEKVHFLSYGVETSFLESYFIGWVTFVLFRKAFVITTQRILLIQINSRSKPLELKAQITYPAMDTITGSPLSSTKLRLKNGKKLIFSGVPMADRKYMKEMLNYLRDTPASSEAGIARGKENLCPDCYTAAEGFPAKCSSCERPFKSASKAGWLSLLLPGLGDIYLGHRFLGTLEVIGALAGWSYVAFMVLAAEAEMALVLLVIFAVFGLMAHVVDALVTRHIGRKGIYPA